MGINWIASDWITSAFSCLFCLFPQLSEVNDSGLVCSAVLSPLSHSTALLTVLQSGITQQNQFLTTEIIAPATAETSAELPDVVSSVLGVVYNIMEEDGDSVDGKERIVIFIVQNIKRFCLDFSVIPSRTHIISTPKIKKSKSTEGCRLTYSCL